MIKKLTADRSCKNVGLDGIHDLSKRCGKPVRTLQILFNENRLAFDNSLLGAALNKIVDEIRGIKDE